MNDRSAADTERAMERAMERQRERLHPEPDSDYLTENPLCEHGQPQYNCGRLTRTRRCACLPERTESLGNVSTRPRVSGGQRTDETQH